MLGDSLFAAPVLVQGQTTRHLVLPPGDWFGWWDGQKVSGGPSGMAMDVDAPPDTLPLFLKAGGIVPMLRPDIDTLAPSTASGIESYANDPGILYVRVAPDAAASRFQVFDGTALSQQLAGDGLHLGFTPGADGVFQKGVLFEVIGTPQPASVSNNGAALSELASADALTSGDGWFWQPQTGGRSDSGFNRAGEAGRPMKSLLPGSRG